MKTKEYKLYGGHNRVVHHIQALGYPRAFFVPSFFLCVFCWTYVNPESIYIRRLCWTSGNPTKF